MNGVLRDETVPRRKTNMDRDRLELRAEPEWIARVAAAADRFGLSVSAFVRLATTRYLEEIERTPAPEPPKKGRSK